MSPKPTYSKLAVTKSFNHAFNGIKLAYRHEKNFRTHIILAAAAVTGGLILDISLKNWALIVIAISIVLVCEMINTAIERICDILIPSKDDRIKAIKDMAAGSVLVASFGAIILAVLVFLPYAFKMLDNL